jgi:opacity protein-like surface antigen
MKKLMMAAIGLMMATVSVNAQYLNESDTPFTEGKFYVSASASSASFSYSKNTDFKLGLNARAGYLFLDNVMALGVFEFVGQNNFDILTTQIGAGARYYFESCGIYLGAIAKYAHVKSSDVSFSDFRPEIHAGYCFFLGEHLTLDPEVYYEHSFKDSDYSGLGVRIGLGVYF